MSPTKLCKRLKSVKILFFDNEKLQMVHTNQELFYDKNFISTEMKNPCFKTN